MVTMTAKGSPVPVAPTASASVSNGNDSHRENGRDYHSYRRGMYMYPCDEKEQNRMDIFHQLMKVARRDDLHSARIHGPSPRILDLGTGTGIWAIELADQLPEAEVIGIDLAPIQPGTIPLKLRFRVVDYESHWSLGEESWDFIHMRGGCGSVQSWPELYQKVFAHLVPGTGMFEQVEVDLEPRCNDGTMPQSATDWYSHLKDATRRVARPIEYQTNTREMLEKAGFVDIEEKQIIAPFNTWPKDSHQREIGRWYCACLFEGLEALSLGPLTRVFKWTAKEVKQVTDEVKEIVVSRKHHGYNVIHIWTARRPGN